MLAFCPPAFRSVGPSLRGALLAQVGPIPAVTPGEIKAVGAGLGLVSTALFAATAWVGIHTGTKEKGLLSIAGWVVGAAGGLVGAASLFGLLQLLAMPAAEIQRVIDEAQRKAASEAPAPAPRPRTFEV